MQDDIDALALLAHQASAASDLTQNLQLLLRSGQLGVLAVVTPIERADELRKDRPDEILLGILVVLGQFLDQSPQISIPTILHVQMQVRTCLDVFSTLVLDDVGMNELL